MADANINNVMKEIIARDRMYDLRELLAKVEECKRVIGAERDKLEDLLSDLDSLVDDCKEADESLQYAIEALSRLM